MTSSQLVPFFIEEELASGMLFVAAPPRYHDPMFVRAPFSVRKEALGPMFETSDLKAPK